MSRARRRRHQRGARSSDSLGWVDQLWDYVTHPGLLGAVASIAGVMLMSAPWLKLPTRKLPDWWALPVQATDVLQVSVLLGTLVGVLGAGLCIKAFMERRGEDVRVMASLLTMGIGIAGCVGCWLSLQSDVPATQATFGIGQQVEYVVGRVRGEPVRIMLPRRVKVDKLVATQPASLTLTLNRPKQRDASPQTLAVGESVEVDGMRFTFIGSSVDTQQLQGVVAGSSSQSIAAAARKGSTVRVTLDGPEYEVKDISLNYIGLGPAVQLGTEDLGSFWVFERQREQSARAFDHGLQLMRVESMPAAVMTVAPVRHFEPLAIFGGVFALGLGGLLLWGGRREELDPEAEQVTTLLEEEEE